MFDVERLPSLLQRYEKGHEGILDPCWRAKIDLGDLDDFDPGGFFGSTYNTVFDMFVAGRAKGPNPKALHTAKIAIERLQSVLADLDPSFLNDWNFSTIWVPYQFVELYFMTFWSEYGVQEEVPVKLRDCRFGKAGISVFSDSNFRKIARLPYTMANVLEELRVAAGISSVDELNRCVAKDDILGPEKIDDLIDAFHETKHLLDSRTTDYCSKLIRELEEFAV